MENIVVLVTSYSRYLASAPKVRWQAGAEAIANQSGGHSDWSTGQVQNSYTHPSTSSLIYKRDGHEPYTPNKALAGREHERQISGIQALSPLRLVLPRGSRSGEGSESDDPTPTCSARTRKATPLSPRWLCDRSSSAADGHSAVTCFILDAVSVCCTFTVRSVCRPAHPPHRIEFQGPVDLIYNGKINLTPV
jgi:hypothetical protein